MQERDTYGKIRATLLNAEVQAPDFDTLFGKEALGGDSLRSALATKLLDHTAVAPDFDALFAGETLGETLPKPITSSKIRLFPWWSIAGVAAACLAVFFLLPKQLGTFTDPLSNAPTVETVSAPSKKIIQVEQPVKPIVTAQLLTTPSAINPLGVENKYTAAPETLDANLVKVASETVVDRDTTSTENLTKIKPTRSKLFVKSWRSVEEAYASARVRKPRIKPDKVAVGLGMNSANRLLTMVNSKSDGGFALQAVASSGSDGYASLEGASASLLRTTATASVNEWARPDNITAAMLENCKTNYELPINFGLTVSLPIIHDLNLITGVQYTYMVNHISGTTFNLKQELHYLGIPVKIAVNLVKRGDFVVYSALGGTIEKGLAGNQTSTVDGEGEWKGTQSISGFQSSLIGQFGVSYSLKTNFLLYFEPGVAWYIPSDQPISDRTQEPFNFNLSLGIRYRLQ